MSGVTLIETSLNTAKPGLVVNFSPTASASSGKDKAFKGLVSQDSRHQ
jgi:hypothetical protein